MRYSKEKIEELKNELENKCGRNSTEIAKKLNIPDFAVRRYAVKFGLKFGHFTPFKSKDPIFISNELNEIIIGSLLGDGYMTIHRKNKGVQINKNSKLAIKHCLAQKDYVYFKYKLISRNCDAYIKSYYKKEHRVGTKWKDSYTCEVETLQNVSFNKYRNEWYPNGRKIVPASLIELSPLSLAIWFQDDGYKKDNATYLLCTNGFSVDDVFRLREILFNQYGILTTTQLTTSGQPMIYVRSSSANKFTSIIDPYICESMRYKIIVRNKSCELLETPEEDNQQPSIIEI